MSENSSNSPLQLPQSSPSQTPFLSPLPSQLLSSSLSPFQPPLSSPSQPLIPQLRSLLAQKITLNALNFEASSSEQTQVDSKESKDEASSGEKNGQENEGDCSARPDSDGKLDPNGGKIKASRALDDDELEEGEISSKDKANQFKKQKTKDTTVCSSDETNQLPKCSKLIDISSDDNDNQDGKNADKEIDQTVRTKDITPANEAPSSEPKSTDEVSSGEKDEQENEGDDQNLEYEFNPNDSENTLSCEEDDDEPIIICTSDEMNNPPSPPILVFSSEDED